MAFNAAKQPFIFSAVFSVLLSTLFAVRYSLAPYPIEKPFTDGMPLAAIFTGFSVDHTAWAAAIAIILLIWTLFIVIQLSVRYSPATNRNYIPIQIFVITACGTVIPGEALASYAAAFLLALSVRQLITSFRKNYRFEETFRGGLYLGFIPLLYAPGAILMLLAPVILSLYRRSSRELAVCAAGMLLPVAGASFIYWAVDTDAGFIFREIWRGLTECPAMTYPDRIPIVAAVCAGLTAVLIIMAVTRFVAQRKGMRTKQRKVMAHISMTFLALLISLALPGSSTTVIPLIAVTAAIAIPYAFSGKQTAAASIVYCLIIAAVFALNIPPIFGVSVP